MSNSVIEKVFIPANNEWGCWEIEIEQVNTGRYGWKAEASALVGVREFAATRDEALSAVLEHLKAEIPNQPIGRSEYGGTPAERRKQYLRDYQRAYMRERRALEREADRLLAQSDQA